MSASTHPSLVWFRQDLRLADNPALEAAAERGPVVALYVLDDETSGRWAIGGAQRWWLHHSLTALGKDLARRGVPLVLRRGRADKIVPRVAAEVSAGAVYWSRCYEPFAVERGTEIKTALRETGLEAESFAASLLAEPWTIRTKADGPFRVFTPFWRALRETTSVPSPRRTPTLGQKPISVESDDLADWKLLPTKPDWAAAFADDWTPGEAGAQTRLGHFIEHVLSGYATDRDLPGRDGVSRLSAHLHWGEISVRQVWHAVALHSGGGDDAYLRELAWRDFAHHLLWQFPELPEKPFDERFAGFPWRKDTQALKAWQQGQTGYPLIDAGMRQLWRTGWMHNRVRMAAASFLIKHLLLPWQEGEAWFWDTLVDADLANNAMNWQWVAGCGADAAPYFRIFNPVLQGEKFDPGGRYVRRWVPEVAELPDTWLHKPWEAPAQVLAKAGVELGKTYPHPIVDHRAARERALEAFAAIKE